MKAELKNLADKITCNTDYLSQQEMEDYYNGMLSNEEMHAVEMKLAHCEFSTEAFEGLAVTSGSAAAIASLNQIINKKIKPFYAKPPFLIAAGLIVTAGLLFTTSNWSSFPEEISFPAAENKVENIVVFTVTPEVKEEIEEAIYLPEEEQINPLVTIEEVDEIEKTEAIIRDTTTYETINPTLNIGDPESKYVSIHKPHLPMKEMEDFKVVNYDKSGRDNINANDVGLTGVAAIYQNQQQKGEDPGVTTIERVEYVSYNDFLSLALRKFKRYDYKSALKDFMLILDHYSDDLNAKFYGGLCCYNINRLEQAHNYFDEVLNSASDNFNQESKWYKALTLIQLDEFYNARILLQKIENEGLFYSQRAKEKLNQISRL